MKDAAVYLHHILECIGRIEEDTREGRDAFFASHTLQDAVLRNVQTLSESAQRLPAPVKDAHPEVEWRAIAAFRNVLVHNYLGIDLEKIWDIVQRDIPRLKRSVILMLKSLKEASQNP